MYGNPNARNTIDWSFNSLTNDEFAAQWEAEWPDKRKNLRHLHLRNNFITILPRSVFQSFLLSVLNISSNELLSLPRAVGLLRNLTVLDVSKNKLVSLPRTLVKLLSLTTLYTYGNDLPFEFCNSFLSFEKVQKITSMISDRFQHHGVRNAALCVIAIYQFRRLETEGIWNNLNWDIAKLVARWVWESRDEECWAKADSIAWVKCGQGKSSAIHL